VTSIPKEQTKYCNKVIINVCEFGNMWAKYRSEKKIAGKKNRWEKSKIDSSVHKGTAFVFRFSMKKTTQRSSLSPFACL